MRAVNATLMYAYGKAQGHRLSKNPDPPVGGVSKLALKEATRYRCTGVQRTSFIRGFKRGYAEGGKGDWLTE
jgi:hypothetical protein